MGAGWAAAAPLDLFRGHVTVLKAHGGYGGGGGGGDPADRGPGRSRHQRRRVGRQRGLQRSRSRRRVVLRLQRRPAGRSIICAGTIEECLGLTGAPVSCEVVLDSPDGKPRMRVGLPPLTRYIDKSSPLLGDGPADLIEIVYNGIPATPWTEIVAMDLMMGGIDGELVVTSAGEIASLTSVNGRAPHAGMLTLMAPSPNPFNPSTEIAFELARSADVTLQVFDLRGQMVRELVRGVQPAGEFRANWNGLDRDGRQVASGTYFFRLSSGGDAQVRKAVLLK